MIEAMLARLTTPARAALLTLLLLVSTVFAACRGTAKAGADASAGAGASSREQLCDDPLTHLEIPPGDRVVNRYARNFAIEYDGQRKRVTVENPWRNADLALTHLLVPCGDPEPDPVERQTVVRIPVERAVTTSTTQLPHFTALAIVDRLAGHNRLDYVWEPEIRHRIEAGLVAEVGDSVRLDLEALLALRPDLVLATSIGNPELDVFALLERAGLPYAVDAAWTEETPLGRAEWIKFTAAFFNREAEANRLFDEIAARYEELRAIARNAPGRPTVLVGTPFQGTWHVSGGAAYQARLIADAGGDYLWADDPTTGAIPLDFESVYARGLNADVWIHPYGWHSLADGVRADERMADFAAWKSGRVYNNDARVNEHGGNDYWETGSLRPDLILADLIEICHPGLIEHELVFHRRLPRSG
jgi:iron complex transport system substrate-binding protein